MQHSTSPLSARSGHLSFQTAQTPFAGWTSPPEPTTLMSRQWTSHSTPHSCKPYPTGSAPERACPCTICALNKRDLRQMHQLIFRKHIRLFPQNEIAPQPIRTNFLMSNRKKNKKGRTLLYDARAAIRALRFGVTWLRSWKQAKDQYSVSRTSWQMKSSL